MAPKLPFMPFYGADFYDDERVRLMDLAEEATYMRLLWMQWREGSLPGEPGVMSRLIHVDGVTAQVLDCFPVSPDGRRRNLRLEMIRNQQEIVRQKQSEGGKRGRATQIARTEPGVSPGRARGKLGQSDTESDTDTTNNVAAATNGHSRDTWLTPFSQLWTIGQPPFGTLAREIKPLVAEHGEAEVLTHWTHYLAGTEPKFWSPRRFSNTYNTWNAAVTNPDTRGLQDEPVLDWQ